MTLKHPAGRISSASLASGNANNFSGSSPRAKVQLAELYLAKNQPELARAEVKDVVSDDQHAPTFQRKRDRVWVRRARSLMGKLK